MTDPAVAIEPTDDILMNSPNLDLIALAPSDACGWQLNLLLNPPAHGHDLSLLTPSGNTVWIRQRLIGVDAIVEAYRDVVKQAADGGYMVPSFDTDEVRRKVAEVLDAVTLALNDPLGDQGIWADPAWRAANIVLTDARAPTLIGDPLFSSVTAKLSRYNPADADELTVTLRNTGSVAVEGYRFSLLPPAGRQFGSNMGVSGSHPYDWSERQSMKPGDGARHIAINRLVPGARATLVFYLVPPRRMTPEQALAHAACIALHNAPQVIHRLREAGYELALIDLANGHD